MELSGVSPVVREGSLKSQASRMPSSMAPSLHYGAQPVQPSAPLLLLPTHTHSFQPSHLLLCVTLSHSHGPSAPPPCPFLSMLPTPPSPSPTPLPSQFPSDPSHSYTLTHTACSLGLHVCVPACSWPSTPLLLVSEPLFARVPTSSRLRGSEKRQAYP